MLQKSSGKPLQNAKAQEPRQKRILKKAEFTGSIRDSQLGILVNEQEYKAIFENAEKYHNGNMSDWVRMRAIMPCLDISVDMDNDKLPENKYSEQKK